MRSRTSSCRPPRLEPPAALAEICSAETLRPRLARLRQVLPRRRAGFRGRFDHAARRGRVPARRGRRRARCSTGARRRGAAAIPYGGGHQRRRRRRGRGRRRVRGRGLDRPRPLDRVLEVDRVSRAARIQAGATGPGLEEQLREHGLTLRHFPQSFELSTLGGWIATRAGGHFATLYTHIDDLVESIRAVTPTGADREPAPAGVGRRAEPGPDADRLGGNPRRDHRGLGARSRTGRPSRRPRP